MPSEFDFRSKQRWLIEGSMPTPNNAAYLIFALP